MKGYAMSPDTTQQLAIGCTYPLSGRNVARIGYGAMQLRAMEDRPAEAVALIEKAIELGVDHVDTAEFYGDGFVNRTIRKALAPGHGVVIASKVGADPNPGAQIPLIFAQRPEQLRASVERNLSSLGLEQISLVNLRRGDVGPGIKPEGDQIVDLDDQIAAMIAMRDAGKIGAIGLSGIDLVGLRRLLSAGIACVQNAYSLVSRQFEDMLALCLAHQIAWVPFFPLGGTFPGWPKVTDNQTVVDVAARLSVTPAQVGLAWLLRHAPNTLLIPGTTNLEHLKKNMAVAKVALDEAAMSELDAVETIAAAPRPWQ